MSHSTSFKKIALLAGGKSQERDISLRTGKAVYEALVRLGYNVTQIDPTPALAQTLIEGQFDVVYNALHGTYGEDGIIQGTLEWLGIPYTGSGLKASVLAMDKSLSRRIFEQEGIPIAQGRVWQIDQDILTPDALPKGPWVFKPCAEGSSVGVSRCADYDELFKAMTQAKESKDTYAWLIETWILGPEISVTLFDGEVWGAVEIEPSEGWYDYQAKYQRGDTTYHIPPRLDQQALALAYEYAKKGYFALGCRGVSRMDMIIQDRQYPIALEMNTLPGMTQTSLVPKIAAQQGFSFDQLVDLILKHAQNDIKK
jgi:D-alanine-D-alanine ligase